MPARMSDVVVVDQGLLSAYGAGVARCADGLLAGRRVFQPAGGSFPAALAERPVGKIPAAAVESEPLSGLLACVHEVLAGASPIPADAALYLATTVGEISNLEAEILSGASPTDASRISLLPQRVASALGLSGRTVQVVSAACASSTAALALAASAVRRGEIDCALVVACDGVSEFVLSGFAALMALDPQGARPFDADRRGVTLGAAAAFALVMSRERAVREHRPCLGVVGGWGMTCDANHLTGPSRDGAPLAEAVRAALQMAACEPAAVSAICAHGTGTVYNDQMELLAFKRVFGGQPRPVFAVKGGMGHTLGAAGLAEVLLSLEFLRRGKVPATLGLVCASPEARGWVTEAAVAVPSSGVVLTTNSGFGGVNAALVLALASFPPSGCASAGDGELNCSGTGLCLASGGTPVLQTVAPPPHSGRLSAEARLATYAVAHALGEAGLVLEDGAWRPAEGRAPRRIGVVACERDGSLAANRAYFTDYARTGRVLGRGQLFACTLPTSVAAECAIACRLTGPLLYVAEPEGGEACAVQAVRGLLADASADAMVVLSVTAGEARASVYEKVTR